MLQKCPSISSLLPLHLINHSVYIMETRNNSFVYSDHRQPPFPSFTLDLNHRHELGQDFIYTEITTTKESVKEPMFEKSLTPSDVEKLNRLVIPKQHAEKYFLLGGCADPGKPQKSLLLSFEDESGNPWRFRYSYWNSSQSYVLTKGWRRYVKEKRLDAGDVVVFEQHISDCERMFIGWRRRSASVPIQDRMEAAAAAAQPVGDDGALVSEWSTRAFYNAQSKCPSHHLPLPLPLPYQPNCHHADNFLIFLTFISISLLFTNTC